DRLRRGAAGGSCQAGQPERGGSRQALEARLQISDRPLAADARFLEQGFQGLKHDELRSNCSRAGTAPPLPFGGGGWGGGVAASPPFVGERAPTRIASNDAMRPPPQAGEVQRARGYAVDSSKIHRALAMALLVLPACLLVLGLLIGPMILM